LSEIDRESNIAKEGMRDLKNKVEEEKKRQMRKWVVTFIVQHFATIAIVFGAVIGCLLIIFAIGDVLGLLDGGGSGNSAYAEGDFTTLGTLSPFGFEISKEEFVEGVQNYNGGSDYNTYMKPYAEEFFDVCVEYNINPCLAFAHACLETGFGSNNGCKNDKNYFGMAHYNTANGGASYSSVADSIKAYCEWVINASTEGTSDYNANCAKAEEYGEYNSKLKGTPKNNIYVLYCRYAYLGDTHLCNEPDFDNPKGTDYYKNNGSNLVTGGRIYIYEMYENGGLYTGKYKELCGHSNASDSTTTQEKADYQEYTTNKRIKIAKNIFGNKAFITISYNGDIITSAIKCHEYLRVNGYQYAQAGVSIPDGLLNGKTVDCSSYVTWVLYCTGYEEMEGYQQTSVTFNNNSWGWEEISLSEAQPGDIVTYSGHVEIIAEVTSSDHLRVYNCGGNNSISAVGTAELPESSKSGYTKNKIKKILRPQKDGGE